ncbi:MAG: TetR/AcrR family transcriptional regulator [Mycobacterium sp.]|nr:TetR/AcrR family transcriptional regulator [Mycobacterium sp.]
MPKVKSAPSRPKRSEVRARILAAAMSTFAKHGFAGASIDAIAEAAGFTKGAVYSNFGSKDDLFFALMDQQIELRTGLVTEVARDLPQGGPQALAAIGERLTRAITENREWQLLFVDYWARAVRDPSIRARFVEHRRAVRALMGDAVEQAARSLNIGVVLPTDVVSLLLLGLSNGLAIEELAAPGTVPTSLIGSVLTALIDQ